MTRFVKLVALALVACGLVAGVTPWRIGRATVAGAFTGGLARGAGLRATVAGPVTFKLLPRPRLQATQLSLAADDGTVLMDAPLLKADLDIPSLLRGVWRMSSATLVEPTLTVDLDGVAMRPPPGPAAEPGRPATLRVRSGLLKTRSATGFADLLVTGIDAAVTWSADGDDLVVSGVGTLRGTKAQFTGSLSHPLLGLTSAGSSASLRVESSLFDLSADGILSGGPLRQFAGRASLATASLPRLMRTVDGLPLSLASKRATISGDIVAKPHDVSLSSAQLRLDKARFEGTLAWRRDGGRGLIAGTLATDLLDLDALAGDGLDPAEVGGLYRRPLTASPFGTDIDMRISATEARCGRMTLQDAAFATLVRGNRLELTLDEAGAYGGVIKARAVATLGPDGIEAHADVSSKHLDLGLISEGLSGRDRIGGILTARATVDGHGGSFRDVVADLAGEGQVGVEAGRLADLSLAQAFRRLGRRMPLDAHPRGTPTTFDKAQWDVTIRDGAVSIPDGRLTAPGVTLAFGAKTDLPDGRVDIQAVAAETDRSGALVLDGPSLPLTLRGFWTGPLTLASRGAGWPALDLPLADGLAAGQ